MPRLIEYAEQKNYENVLEDLIGDLMDSNQIRMIYQTLKILPQIELDMKVTGPMPSMGDEAKADRKQKTTSPSNVKRIKVDSLDPQKYYELYEDEDYVLNLDIRRINKQKNNQGQKATGRAYCPKMQKPKDENWVS